MPFPITYGFISTFKDSIENISLLLKVFTEDFLIFVGGIKILQLSFFQNVLNIIIDLLNQKQAKSFKQACFIASQSKLKKFGGEEFLCRTSVRFVRSIIILCVQKPLNFNSSSALTKGSPISIKLVEFIELS